LGHAEVHGVSRRRTGREPASHFAKWYAWSDAVAAGGQRVGGYPVAGFGKTLRGTDEMITDGPCAESKDLVTGDLIIDVPSIEVAVSIARDCPVFEFDGSVEVVPCSIVTKKPEDAISRPVSLDASRRRRA